MKAIALAVALVIIAAPASGHFSRGVRGHARTSAVEFGENYDRAKVRLTIRSRLSPGTRAYCRFSAWTDWSVDGDRDPSTFDPDRQTFRGVSESFVRLKRGRHHYRVGWVIVEHPTMVPALDQPAESLEGSLPNGRSFLRHCHT